jgi:hypothetical protein
MIFWQIRPLNDFDGGARSSAPGKLLTRRATRNKPDSSARIARVSDTTNVQWRMPCRPATSDVRHGVCRGRSRRFCWAPSISANAVSADDRPGSVRIPARPGAQAPGPAYQGETFCACSTHGLEADPLKWNPGTQNLHRVARDNWCDEHAGFRNLLGAPSPQHSRFTDQAERARVLTVDSTFSIERQKWH